MDGVKNIGCRARLLIVKAAVMAEQMLTLRY